MQDFHVSETSKEKVGWHFFFLSKIKFLEQALHKLVQRNEIMFLFLTEMEKKAISKILGRCQSNTFLGSHHTRMIHKLIAYMGYQTWDILGFIKLTKYRLLPKLHRLANSNYQGSCWTGHDMCKNNAMPKMPSSKVRAWEQVKGQEWELEVTMVECRAYGVRENYFSHPQVQYWK